MPVGRGVEVALDRSEPPRSWPFLMLENLAGGGGGLRVRAIETRVCFHAAPHAEGITSRNLRKGCRVRPAQELRDGNELGLAVD